MTLDSSLGDTGPISPALPPLDPVTLVIRRRVKLGHETDYEALISEMTTRLTRWPGHRGTGVIRPASPQGEYHVVVRFDDARQAAAWETSAERAEWLTRLAPHLAGEAEFEQQPGLEFWFTPPSSPVLRQPRRWKMMAVTLLALYPTSLLINLLVGPSLSHLPLALRSFLQALLVVPLMTYLVMPFATRAFRSWLKP